MAITGLSGYGFTSINTQATTGQTAVFNSPASSFNLTTDETEVEAKGYPIGGSGLLENIYAYISERVWNLEVGFQAFDWGVLQMVFGYFEATTSSIKFRQSYTGTVPATAAYEIVDANLTGLSVADVKVSVFASSANAFTPLKVVTGVPNAGEVQLDAANTKLIFNAAQAGLDVSYQLNESYSNIKTLGVEAAANTLDNVSFSGLIRLQSNPSKIGVDIPQMGKTGGFSLQVGEENTVTFKPVVTGANASAVRFYIPA